RRLQGGIEGAEEARSILPSQRCRSAAPNTDLAQMTSELAASERAADIGLRQRTPGWRHDARALGQATRRQRNVGGHADIAVGNALGDPVVGRVRPIANQ